MVFALIDHHRSLDAVECGVEVGLAVCDPGRGEK
jgi:hypothetical protein